MPVLRRNAVTLPIPNENRSPHSLPQRGDSYKPMVKPWADHQNNPSRPNGTLHRGGMKRPVGTGEFVAAVFNRHACHRIPCTALHDDISAREMVGRA